MSELILLIVLVLCIGIYKMLKNDERKDREWEEKHRKH